MSETAIAIGILWSLLFSCGTIAIALGIAWAQFDHPRYALCWALAFGINAIQAAENIAALVAGPNIALRIAAYALVMIPAPLVAIGARQRAGLPDRRYRYLAIALPVLAYGVIGQHLPQLAPYSHPVVMVFVALGLLDAAAVLRPRPPRSEVAEWALAGAILVNAVIELLIAGLTCAYDISGGAPTVGFLYHGLLLAAVPPCVIAVGVSAILLVASDLARELRRIAACDPLTGLYNRRGFQHLAMQALARARASRQPVSLAVGDIDHFKRINDDHGHAIGDRTLVLVGGRLSAGARADDLVGRIGGEEFAVLMLDNRGYEAAQTMDRIRLDIAEGLDAGEALLTVTVSFGIAEVGTDGPIEAMLADALDRADRALYRSKVGGRNRVTLASPNEPDAGTADEEMANAW